MQFGAARLEYRVPDTDRIVGYERGPTEDAPGRGGPPVEPGIGRGHRLFGDG